MTPLDFNRGPYNAYDISTDIKMGEAVAYDNTTQLTLKKVTSITDFVVGFAAMRDYKAGDKNCQIFVEGGEIYALNGSKALKKGDQVTVDGLGRLRHVDFAQPGLGYVTADISANAIGPMQFQRDANREFLLVEFKSSVTAGQGVKLVSGGVDAITSVAHIAFGFAVKAQNNGDFGFIYYKEGTIVRMWASGVNLGKGVYVKMTSTGRAVAATINKDHIVGLTVEDCLKNTIGRVQFTRFVLNK